MNFEDVETFLAIVDHKTVAGAADDLYIGQGTASMRLARLEKELGKTLVFRQRGVREISLTPAGQRFLLIAREMITLYQEAHRLADEALFQELRVAALGIFNEVYFVPVYQSFMARHPGVRLYLQTEHASETHRMIENQRVDVGFVFNLHEAHNVVSTPLFHERMAFLYRADSAYARTGDESDLELVHEIYQPWSREHAIWHENRFGDARQCFLTLGTASMLFDFIDWPESWTITTHRMAQQAVSEHPGLAYRLIERDPPPRRTAHILLYRYPKPWVHELAQLFLEDVYEMVAKTPELELAEL